MRFKLLFIGLLALLSLMIYYGVTTALRNNNTYASNSIQGQANITVSAFIGEYRFTLYGYSSPNALITLQGMGVYDQTYADNTGYFEFKNRFSPQSPREACLTSQDQFGRTTAPNCLPPFPTEYNVTIGPVIMPPTISLNANTYYEGDDVKLSGQTIPNTEVAFSTFVDTKPSVYQYLSHAFDLVQPVEAAAFPRLTIKTDSKGNFSLALPSSRPDIFRLFAQTSYDSGISPQSIKLNLKIYPLWWIIVELFLILFSLIKKHALELIILGELVAIMVYLLRRYMHPHVIVRNRALALRELFYHIVKEETALMIPEKFQITNSK